MAKVTLICIFTAVLFHIVENEAMRRSNEVEQRFHVHPNLQKLRSKIMGHLHEIKKDLKDYLIPQGTVEKIQSVLQQFKQKVRTFVLKFFGENKTLLVPNKKQ